MVDRNCTGQIFHIFTFANYYLGCSVSSFLLILTISWQISVANNLKPFSKPSHILSTGNKTFIIYLQRTNITALDLESISYNLIWGNLFKSRCFIISYNRQLLDYKQILKMLKTDHIGEQNTNLDLKNSHFLSVLIGKILFSKIFL